MDSVIINFEKLKQQHLQQISFKKELLIQEYQNEITQNEDQIRSLVIQINQLQANIDFNIKLIEKIKQQKRIKN